MSEMMENQPSQSPGGQAPNGSTGLASNVAALLCYIFPPITGIIFILIEKEDTDVKFHAWQATILFLASFFAIIGLQILAMFFGYIWGFLGGLISLLSKPVILGLFILWIVCMVKAYQGERWRIPVIGDLADKRSKR